MAASDADIRERLSVLWEEFGLTPDVATAKAQHTAARAVEAWLMTSEEDPEIAIRAAQILLMDPERPGANKRRAWGALRSVLSEAWPNAGTAGQNIAYAQALLLATWPPGTQEAWLGTILVFDSARAAVHGAKQRQEAVDRWRANLKPVGSRAPRAVAEAVPNPPKIVVTQFDGITLDVTAALKQMETHRSQNSWGGGVGAEVVQVLRDYGIEITKISDSLKLVSREVNKQAQALVTYTGQTIKSLVAGQVQGLREEVRDNRAELGLLWWGQARYCHALGIPYRRLAREGADSLLWWVAYEAADLSQELETEPAAAYLVETLHGLGQDIFERKTLGQWIEGTCAALQSLGDKAPRVSANLKAVADGDLLGLPVTWARLNAARNGGLAGAADAVALDLETEIDRGEWASWIFREILLDRFLAGDS
ncbi:MAG: GTPase-associated system all-helical protein GASH [Byssovorax sp.]